MRHSLDSAGFEKRLREAQVGAVRLEQHSADRLIQFRHIAIDRQLQMIEDNPARERIAVGVEAG